MMGKAQGAPQLRLSKSRKEANQLHDAAIDRKVGELNNAPRCGFDEGRTSIASNGITHVCPDTNNFS
jgi:hypothetical protein